MPAEPVHHTSPDAAARWRAHWAEQGSLAPTEDEARFLRRTFGELRPRPRAQARVVTRRRR